MAYFKGLDLNLLVVFEAIYSAGNISRAGNILGLSQPTVSNCLTRLREVLDDQLFVRSGQGVSPTPKAVRMIDPVREMLRIAQSEIVGGGTFDPDTDRRHFRLVVLDQVEMQVMPPILNRIQEARSITLETFHIYDTPPVTALSDNSIDLVIGPFLSGPPELVCTEIGSFGLVVIARKGHPDIRGELSLDHFRTMSGVALPPRLRAMSFIDEELRRRGIERHIAYTANKIWSFPAIVASSDLLGVIPDSFARIAADYFPIDVYPLPVEVPRQKLYMTWKQRRVEDVGLKWLRSEIAAAAGADG